MTSRSRIRNRFATRRTRTIQEALTLQRLALEALEGRTMPNSSSHYFPSEIGMGSPNSEHTNPELLKRVGQDPRDQAAWGAFVAHYRPKIRAWCFQRGLQAADVDDVTQDVLLRLTRALRKFTYDPSRKFRGWLRVMTEHAVSDFFADRKRRPRARGEDRGLAALATAEAQDELLALVENEFTIAVLVQASATVHARVEPQTWEAFRLTACENRAGEDVAAMLGMNVLAVFKAKSRVLQYIRQEIERLNGGS
jgi:RNA polymerase sigma-70 factor (ECF subfamily)